MINKNQPGRPIILIADDHDVMRGLLRHWLAINFPAFHIMEAKNGEEAVYLALAWKPEVILMDIWMSEMNGFEATRRIKTTAPDIKIVIITADENNHCRGRASLAGADAYFLKREIADDLITVLRGFIYQDALAQTE
jgi:CheY-like chemotaxis protein